MGDGLCGEVIRPVLLLPEATS